VLERVPAKCTTWHFIIMIICSICCCSGCCSSWKASGKVHKKWDGKAERSFRGSQLEKCNQRLRKRCPIIRAALSV